MTNLPPVGNNAAKAGANTAYAREDEESRKARGEGRAAHQVVGGVMAHQADDG